MSMTYLASSFPFVRRRRQGFVGVDLGTQSVKVARLALAGRAKQISEAAVIPLPPNAALTAESIRTGWLAELLQGVVAQFPGLHRQACACGLSLSVTEVRSLTVPPGSLDERREMIAQELAQDRHSPDEVEFDFWDAAPVAPETSAAGVNLVTVSRDLAVEVAEALYQAGLYCETLDGGPFILTRAAALAGFPTDPSQPVAIVDWGRTDALFVVMLRQQPVFTRVLKGCHAASVVDAVSQGLKLAPEECCRILAAYSVFQLSPEQGDHSVQEHVAELAAPALHQLKSELSKTLAYLKHQRPHWLPAELCLTGGGSAICQIGAKLSQELGIPTSSWSVECQSQAGALLEDSPAGIWAQAAALSDLGWAA